MTHSFNAYLATQYDINQAILLSSFAWWHKYNTTNEKNYHDGRYWTYNSIAAFAKQFPYMSQKQIRSTLERLEDNGLIITGSYNKHSYDRTKWYALTSKCLLLLHEHGILKMDDEQVNTICQLDILHLPKSTNGFLQKGEPIPILNPIINTSNISISTETAEEEPYVLPEWVNSTAADQLYHDSKFIQNNGRKEKETEVLSSAQNASDNSSAKKKKVDYTPEFEAMWLTYGNKRNKQESFIAFKKLTPEQQAQMIEFVKMYITVRAPEYRRNMDRLIEKEEYDLLYEEIERAYKAKERTTSVIINDNRAMYC